MFLRSIILSRIKAKWQLMELEKESDTPDLFTFFKEIMNI